jgi:hypothetical protein
LKKLKFLFLILPLFSLTSVLQGQGDWKLERDKEGIRIYSRGNPDSKIKSLKAVCTVESTLSQMTAVLLDIKNQDEWFYHTTSSVLKEISPVELYYYAELDFPMPFSNRDFVEHITVSQNPDTRVLTMTVQNIPNYIPPKKGIIRVERSQCKWVITPTEKNSLLVEFTLFADPAGSIPVWLVNMMSSYGPYETFKKLKTQLKKPQYQNVSLAFIKN